jgi:putative hydrolase of the HAD superfamily
VIKAVFFDAFHTLVYLDSFFERLQAHFAERGVVISLEAIAQAARAEMAHYKGNALRGKDEESLAQLRRACGAALKNGLEAQGVDVPLTTEDVTDVLLRSIHFGVYPEVVGVLQRLKENGCILGVVSNWDYRLPAILNELDVGRFFDFVLTSAACGCEKPDARIFQEALRRAQVAPEETLHVGDSYERDFIGAQQVGIQPVLLQREGNVDDKGIGVIRNLDELPQILVA